jgi:hypothetical protein
MTTFKLMFFFTSNKCFVVERIVTLDCLSYRTGTTSSSRTRKVIGKIINHELNKIEKRENN